MKSRRQASKCLGVCSGVLGFGQNVGETTEICFLKIKSGKATVKLCVASKEVLWYLQGKVLIFSTFSWCVLCAKAILIKWLHNRCRFAYGTLESKNWQYTNPHKDFAPKCWCVSLPFTLYSVFFILPALTRWQVGLSSCSTDVRDGSTCSVELRLHKHLSLFLG